MFEHDYVMRQIKQLAAAIARAASFGRAGQLAEARAELDGAWDELGIPRALLDRFGAGALASLLRDPERRRAVLELLVAEADLRDRQSPSSGDALRALAASLR